MERQRSGSTSSSGSFPTPIPNPYASQLLNGLPDEESESDLSMSPIHRQDDAESLAHNRAREWHSDDEVEIANDEMAEEVLSTMPARLRSRPGSPAAPPRNATQPELLGRTNKSKASRRESSKTANYDDSGDRVINNLAPEGESLGHGTKKSKRSKRYSSERVAVNNDDHADGAPEAYNETSLPAVPGTDEGDAPTNQVQSPKKSKKKHRSKHSKQEDQAGEDGPVDTRSSPGTAPGPAQSDDVFPDSQELRPRGSFNAAGSQRSDRKDKKLARSLDRDITSEVVVNEVPVDDESAERKRRKERKRERRLLGRADELGLTVDTLDDDDLASTRLDAVSSRKKKKGKARKSRGEKDIASEMAEDPARNEEADIPEHMRDFTKESEMTGPPTEEYIDGGVMDGSPALARQRRRQVQSSASKKLPKTIADKQASHASLLAEQDSEGGDTSASHDNQVISPPPTYDQPATGSGTPRVKSRNGLSRRTAALGDQEVQQLNANIHSSGFGESNQALPMADPPPSTAPGSQRSSKRKLKRPFFERDQDSGARVSADPQVDDTLAPVDPGRVPSGPAGTSKPDVSSAPSNVKREKKRKRGAGSEDAIKHEPNGATDSKTKLNSQYMSGPLTLAEQEQVRSAVESVRENAGLSQPEMNGIIHANPQRQKHPLHDQLWNAVVEACPTRPRQKLIIWARQHFHNFVSRGKWTEEQDAELRQMYQIHGPKWSVIGGLINRHQKDVRDRYRNYLVCGDTAKRKRWSRDEEDRFFKVIEKAVDAIRKDLGQGDWDNKSIEDLINWGQISEAMGFERTRLQCLDKWNRLCAANAIPNRITVLLPMGQSSRLAKARKDLQRMTGEEKYLLACGIRDSNAENEPEIPWEEIMTNVFDGKFQRQALLVAWGRLRETVANWEQQTTAECAAQIAAMYEEDNGFLLDDRTVASRSREPTAELGTPSARGPIKRHRSTKSRSLAPKAIARSKPTVDPEDDMSEGGEDTQLRDLLMRGGGRSRSRIDFEEVEESVFGEGDHQSDRDAERANGDESDTDDRDRRHTAATNRKRARERAPSLDLGADPDNEVIDPKRVKTSAVEFSPNSTQENFESHQELRKKETKRKEKGKEKSTDHLKSPRKRRAVDITDELTDGTQDPHLTRAEAIGEFPVKKRRTPNPKTYSSAARKALKRVDNISPRKRRHGMSSENEDDVEDEEHSYARKTPRRRSSSTKSPKKTNGGSLAMGSSSPSTSMQVPPSSHPRAQEADSELSSDMDRDMSDIPDTRSVLSG